MNRRLLVSLITVAVFALTSIVAADGKKLFSKPDETPGPASKSPAVNRRTMAINSRDYRSPGTLRKIIIDTNDTEALANAAADGATEIGDYGSFKLFAVSNEAVERDGKRHLDSSRDNVAAHQYAVRDDYNVLLLRSGAIDTTDESAPGRFIGMGRAANMKAQSAAASRTETPASKSPLRLIQFVGPVKREWLNALRASGLEPIAYVPNNAYLVRGDETATAGLMQMASRDQFVQWDGPFLDSYKIDPQLNEAINTRPNELVSVGVQVVRSMTAQPAGAGDDVKAAKQLAANVLLGAHDVMNFTNLRLSIPAGKITQLAALPGVVNVERWSVPRLLDERSSMIVAGQLTSDAKSPMGPGYMSWLQSHGFTSPFNFAVDVTDGGLDRGAITADKLHPAFLDGNGQSRVNYARNYTSELDAGDVGGHGTLNLSLVGGITTTDSNSHDSDGFNYGLGIAPFVRLGASKIFTASGSFDLNDPYTKLISEAYLGGARISSNSWGDLNDAYTIDAQEYDSRVRDAVPSQDGNQEMVICFAAGNAGLEHSVGSPSTAKNVITVGASESSRKGGEDGCGVLDVDADSAMDMAFFSSKGPLFDGRMKPDITAPGTHVIGAASQNPDFDGSGICGEDIGKPYFPENQTLYTWSSGTSHSTPQIAGAAALVRQFFINQGVEPSAALVKATLLSTTTYMTGDGANGNLPQATQGWGLVNLSRTFDSTEKIFVNQTTTFKDSGEEFFQTGEVKDPTQPFRVTLCWTDAAGFSGIAPWVNDLDLEVSINGQVYHGNNFLGQVSQPGGTADTKDNVESVWLPAGTVGTFSIRVRATNIAGDGVPGNADSTDQDFALAVYNGERKSAPVASIAGFTLAGGADANADPGETVTMQVNLGDLSPTPLLGGHGTLSTTTPGVTVTSASSDFPDVIPGQSALGLTPFVFTVDKSVPCGSAIHFSLDVISGGLLSRIPFTVNVGTFTPVSLFSDDVEAGGAKWTHGTLAKKKKKKNALDTWALTSARTHSGNQAWFCSDPAQATDTFLQMQSVTLPADGRDLQMVFYHTFAFETDTFDGGVLEISTGGSFEDLGPKIVQGGYNGEIYEFSDSPLAGRPAWILGRLGAFQPVVVDLSSYAGKTVTVRFHFASDSSVKGLGWYIDDVTLGGTRVSCAQ